ncbi:hypothetical protein AKO1_014543, partial [Acrasis kona]
MLSCNCALNITLSSSIVNSEILQRKLCSEEPPLVIDARSREEYMEAHIPNSIHIYWWKSLPELIQKLKKTREIVLYDSLGFRSEVLNNRLWFNGFKNVSVLDGGYIEWRNQGRPLRNYLGQNVLLCDFETVSSPFPVFEDNSAKDNFDQAPSVDGGILVPCYVEKEISSYHVKKGVLFYHRF